MRIEQKQIIKEDGRYLVYYHFPDTATEEETRTFTGIASSAPPVATAADPSLETPATSTTPHHEE